MKTLISLTLLLLSLNTFAQKTTYRVVVKFGSMCCGVPSNQPLLDYIATFKKKNKIKKLACDSIGPLGREGEYNLAFSLKELKKKQAETFVKEVTELAKNMKEKGNTSVEENAEIDKATIGRATVTKKNL
jgi:hypothetical protein